MIEEYFSKRAVRHIALFADGCYGQNKNTIIASMLIYALAKLPSLEEVSIRYFETNHGQNEGDAAHSAISTAISTAGEIYVPSL